jgi:hypothetical protein
MDRQLRRGPVRDVAGIVVKPVDAVDELAMLVFLERPDGPGSVCRVSHRSILALGR